MADELPDERDVKVRYEQLTEAVRNRLNAINTKLEALSSDLDIVADSEDATEAASSPDT